MPTDPADWVIKTCTCGFGGGDYDHEFDSVDEAREFYDYLKLSDSSVLDVLAPDGESRVTKRGLFDYADAVDWTVRVSADTGVTDK